VIVDSRDVLLTSANMTNAAYDKNIELGVLCHGGATAQRVQKHFDSLIARGILKEV
jgi:phosphatidylserine/phosphatidylglycerophosphate/cardiolipin synthase-like enzyme